MLIEQQPQTANLDLLGEHDAKQNRLHICSQVSFARDQEYFCIVQTEIHHLILHDFQVLVLNSLLLPRDRRDRIDYHQYTDDTRDWH